MVKAGNKKSCLKPLYPKSIIIEADKTPMPITDKFKPTTMAVIASSERFSKKWALLDNLRLFLSFFR
jgi:hypothetical protein